MSSSDDQYTSAEDLSMTPPPLSPKPSSPNIQRSSPSTSPPSSFEMIEKELYSQLATVALPDVEDAVPPEEEQASIDEGSKSFQLKSIFSNGDSSKDVKLLRENFFSKPRSKNEPPKVLDHVILDVDAEEEEDGRENADSIDDNEQHGLLSGLPKFAQKLYVDEDTAAAAANEPHERALHTKRYARDRIHLPHHLHVRPEDEIQEGPNTNLDEEVTVRGGGDEVFPNSEINISQIGLLEEVYNNLKNMGIKRLKKIQQTVIPVIQQCKSDIICFAPTGSGKTLSYLITLVNDLVKQNRKEPSAHRKPSVAILLQNHETANQVYRLALYISEGLDLQVISATGNNNMASETSRLKHRGGDMVVGTTGRFIQYVTEGKIPLETLKTLVFDEADQFVKSTEWENSMETFRHHMPADHRTFLFSATYDDTACFSFDNFVKPNYWFVGVGELNQVQALVRQNFLLARGRDHDKTLINLIISKAKNNRCPKTLVFTNTVDKADWISARLRMFEDIPSPFPIRAAALHSLIPATDRDLIFKAFNRPSDDLWSIDVIVASDKIACGVSTAAEIVVNYDIPYDVTTYILRVGRTGRNGHNGEAYTFINSATMDDMSYDDRKKLVSMLIAAKRTDYVPFPDALEDLYQKFTSNLKN